MSNPEITVNVDEYLALDKYEVDEDNAHIELVATLATRSSTSSFAYVPPRCTSATRRGARASTTRAASNAARAASPCGDTIVEKWEFPGPTMGVEYRFG